MKQREDFLRKIVREDLESGRCREVVTRFPPEPNGFPHIGHAKAISVDFGIARDFGGRCHLRMDDTNPVTEDPAYVEAIQEAVHWLGFEWDGPVRHTSDYFQRLYDYAVRLIEMGKAYVDSLSEEEIREYRGTVTEPGRRSKYAERSVEENLDLFERMKRGEFEDGEHVLRAKIDMASPHVVMRDPTLYRIRKVSHHRTGDTWCIYPMYDFTHCLSDSIEGITHSLCTLEFENHRPLYDWILDQLPVPCHPRQIEFARLNLEYTVLSKRKLLQLVEEGYVEGWSDPRMPTISGLRRRGFPPESIRAFCDRIGVAKRDSLIDVTLLENAVREDLNRVAPRYMAVLRPLKVVIENYPEGQVEYFDAINNPEDASMGTRKVPFSRELYIEEQDFREDPPKKFFRLAPGREVRLRYAYFITCRDVVKNDAGETVELRCTYDPTTKGGSASDGRRVKGTLHWVSASHAIGAEIRLYDRLFTKADPNQFEEGGSFLDNLNPASLELLQGARLEPNLAEVEPGERLQFERMGYFCADSEESRPGHLVFNRTVTLRDTWAKIEKRLGKKK